MISSITISGRAGIVTGLKFGGLTFFYLDKDGFPKMKFWYQYKDGIFGKRNELIF